MRTKGVQQSQNFVDVICALVPKTLHPRSVDFKCGIAGCSVFISTDERDRVERQFRVVLRVDALPEIGAAPGDPDRRLAVLRPPPRLRGETEK